MEPLAPWELANTVTGVATLLSGLMALALTACLGNQPARWLGVYLSIVVTGVFTVTYHGLGETHGWKVLDTGSNLVVTWAITAAVLVDFHAEGTARWGSGVSGVVNAGVIALMAWVPATTEVGDVLPFGGWGGYMVGEIVLIANALAVLGLFVANLGAIPPGARRTLGLTAGLFLVGAGLSTAGGDVIVARLFPVHALWHLVGAFGFVALWAFNHQRFVGRG